MRRERRVARATLGRWSAALQRDPDNSDLAAQVEKARAAYAREKLRDDLEQAAAAGVPIERYEPALGPADLDRAARVVDRVRTRKALASKP